MADEDTVRLLVGDTDGSNQLLSSSQIQTLLQRRTITTNAGSVTNVVAAAADAAGAIAAKFARDFDFGEDGQNFQRAQRVDHFRSVERDLRRRAGGYSAPLSIAGTETT